ncbi:MAG: hypothetical protein RIR95_1035 [Pseudomonadota bacterium]
MDDKEPLASSERQRRPQYLNSALYAIAGLLILAVCFFLFRFEAFHSSQGGKVFPPLLFLSGVFFYRAYKRIKGHLSVAEQQKNESGDRN